MEAGPEQDFVRGGGGELGGDRMVVVPQVSASDHRSHDAIASLLRQPAEDRLPQSRGRVEPPATLPGDPLNEVRAKELSECPAPVWQTQPGLLRDLHRRLRAWDHRSEDRLPLST